MYFYNNDLCIIQAPTTLDQERVISFDIEACPPPLSLSLLSLKRERVCVCDLRFSFPFLTFGDLETDLDQERRHYIMCEQRACNKGIDMGVTLPSSQFQNVKFSKFKFFSTDFDLPIGWQ